MKVFNVKLVSISVGVSDITLGHSDVGVVDDGDQKVEDNDKDEILVREPNEPNQSKLNTLE